jgi:hypothetical protein
LTMYPYYLPLHYLVLQKERQNNDLVLQKNSKILIN